MNLTLPKLGQRAKIVLATFLALLLGSGWFAYHQLTNATPKTTHYVETNDNAEALIVIYSGDGGWRSFDQHLADELAKRNPGTYSIIGIDSLQYFSELTSPEKTASDLNILLVNFASDHPYHKIILIGFSFGAEILPFTYNLLPEETKSKVVLLSLLSPGSYAQFKISFDDLLVGKPDLSRLVKPTLPEIRKIDPLLLQCVYGTRALGETICPDEWFARADVIALPGNHHFDKKYDILGSRLSQSLQDHLAKAGNGASND